MAAKGSALVSWQSNEGRNDWDTPIDVPDTMSVESLNVTLRKGDLGSKRPGSAQVTTTGDSWTGAAHLMAFTPGQDPAAIELLFTTLDGTTKIIRVTAAVAASLTLTDAVLDAQRVCSAALNGKLFIAYDSAVNRMHVFDPSLSTTSVRRAGLAPPVAATVANTGAGTYPATLRYYRIQYRVKSGATILRQSNLGPSVSFTPSGTGTAARVTKPAAISEGETHWVIHGSADDAVYYELGEVVVATTTYDDAELVADYDENDASPLEGSFFPFPSTKFIVSDGTRLFGLGAWETSAGDSVSVKAGTLYWTPPLFSSVIDTTSGAGDDERTQATILQNDRLEMSVNAGGVDRGLSGPFYNDIYIFQSKGIYKAVSTGQATAPFRRVTVSKEYGSVSHWSQVIGEDESGNEALYFLDPSDGPRRIVVGSGIQWLGKDVNALWQTVNLAATTSVAHGVYDRRNKRVIWWVAVGSENEPTTTMIVYHVTLGRIEIREDGSSLRKGWAKWTGSLGAAKTSLIFPTTLAASRPIKMCPYIGNATLIARQDGTLNTDYGNAYQGLVTGRASPWGILLRRKRLTESYVTALVQTGVNIRQTITTDFGAQSFTADTLLTAAGSETMVRKQYAEVDISDAIVDQVTLGDASALNTTWALDRWDALVEVQEGAR